MCERGVIVVGVCDCGRGVRLCERGVIVVEGCDCVRGREGKGRKGLGFGEIGGGGLEPRGAVF